MKVIATLNFKGGVGKTTVTWLLARYLVERRGKSVLVLDTDPQMSLTTSVYVTDSGMPDVRFDGWENEARKKGTRLFDLMKAYAQEDHLDFSIEKSLFYQHRANFYVVPSIEELYWYELEAPPVAKLRGFVSSFLAACQKTEDIPSFDYCLVDCPPAFNSLSFSVVSCANLILMPVTPDIFAARGLRIMLTGLKERLEHSPTFIVFMNRAKLFRGQLTKESQQFLNDANIVAGMISEKRMPVSVFNDSFIPERVGIKRALAGQVLPPDLETCFAELWDKIEKTSF